MHRRRFLAAATGLAAAPALARAAGPAPSAPVVEAYARRLQAGLDRTGEGRFVLETEQDLFELHRQVRRDHGLGALAPHEGLALAARAHAADQAMRAYFGHVSPDGFGPAERVGLMARTFLGLPAENIVEVRGAWMGPTPGRLMDSWMNSPGHRANILNGDYDHLGLGVVQRGARTVAVAVFGQRFAELGAPLPLAPAPQEIAAALEAASPAIHSYDLSPVGRDERRGAFTGADGPSGVAPGPYVLRPRLQAGRTFTIVWGPIVELAG